MKKLLSTVALVLMLAPVASASTYQAGSYVTTKNVNVRSLPKAGSARINHIHKGETVNVKRVLGGWCEIEMPKYRHAWVDCSYLEVETTGIEDLNPNQIELDLANQKYDDVAVAKTASGNWTLGDPNAKVTMEEFGDLQCPFCSNYFTSTFPKILKNYIVTGKVKYVYYNYPLDFHAQARNAAMAELCAGDQYRFWQMHEQILTQQDVWSAGETGLRAFDYLATGIGLKKSDLDACMDAKKYDAQIDKDMAEGVKRNVEGTPTFFINGTEIMGAVPYETFSAAIDAELAK